MNRDKNNRDAFRSQPQDSDTVPSRSVSNSSGSESKHLPPPSGAPRVRVLVKDEPAFVTTLREFVMLIALTDEESASLLAGDSVAIANGWTVELVQS